MSDDLPNLPTGFIPLNEHAEGTVYANLDHISLVRPHTFADGADGCVVHILGTPDPLTVTDNVVTVLGRIANYRAELKESGR
ncbi:MULTISPECIES: hypothetical protein [Nocardia]|uniref:hypothetical protein n=1 Tax=Nocardia TaxID=1817 RepID=UPI0024574DD3|nr:MULTISPECIES: hypothetical protein [Nocardia]